ncbi:MAG: hypothetical protein AABW53_02370 [Nanoarchaeota archaeon]
MKIIPKINRALLSLLIGSFTNTAVAEEPGQSTQSTLAKDPKAKESNTGLENNPSENAAAEDISVRRNHLSAAVSYITKDMADRPYENGTEVEFDLKMVLPVGETFSFRQELGFYNQWLYSYENQEFKRNKNEIIYRPQLQFAFVSNEHLQLFAAAGLGYGRYHESISFDGIEGYEKHLGLGANVSLGLYHDNIDAIVTGSCLLGERQSSYDISRGLRRCDIDLELIPRLWRFSLPSSVQVSEGALTEHSGVSGLTRNLALSMQPGINILDNLRLYLNMEIDHQFIGSRNHYTEFKIGGGTAFIWGE